VSDDEGAVRALFDEWVAATEAGDVARLLDLVTDDVLFMTAERAAFGKAELAEGLTAMMRLQRLEVVADLQEVVVLGDHAYVRNHLDVTVHPRAGGPSTTVHSRALSILRKEDGRWRLARDATITVAQA
jgi:uncharacterized protein (TIGR02246 family)